MTRVLIRPELLYAWHGQSLTTLTIRQPADTSSPLTTGRHELSPLLLLVLLAAVVWISAIGVRRRARRRRSPAGGEPSQR